MFRDLLFAGTLVCALSSPGAAATVLSVVDDGGEPIPQFEAMIHTADHGYSKWSEGSDGRVTLSDLAGFRDASVIDLVVRAKVYAPAVVTFSGDEKDKLLAGKATIILERGREVDVQFRMPEGLALPEDFTPEIYFARVAGRVRMMRQPANRARGHFDFNVGDAVSRGANRFSIRLLQNPPPFYVAIHRPGFLQFFEAGPFTASDIRNGRLEIDVPRPAGIDVSFDCGEVPAGVLPYQSVAISILWRIPETNNSYHTVAEDRRDDVRHSLK